MEEDRFDPQQFPAKYKCEICDFCVFELDSLKEHLCTREHQEKERGKKDLGWLFSFGVWKKVRWYKRFFSACG